MRIMRKDRNIPLKWNSGSELHRKDIFVNSEKEC